MLPLFDLFYVLTLLTSAVIQRVGRNYNLKCQIQLKLSWKAHRFIRQSEMLSCKCCVVCSDTGVARLRGQNLCERAPAALVVQIQTVCVLLAHI